MDISFTDNELTLLAGKVKDTQLNLATARAIRTSAEIEAWATVEFEKGTLADVKKLRIKKEVEDETKILREAEAEHEFYKRVYESKLAEYKAQNK